MKKIFMMVACAGLLMACGSKQQKQDAEQELAEVTINDLEVEGEWEEPEPQKMVVGHVLKFESVYNNTKLKGYGEERFHQKTTTSYVLTLMEDGTAKLSKVIDTRYTNDDGTPYTYYESHKDTYSYIGSWQKTYADRGNMTLEGYDASMNEEKSNEAIRLWTTEKFDYVYSSDHFRNWMDAYSSFQEGRITNGMKVTSCTELTE